MTTEVFLLRPLRSRPWVQHACVALTDTLLTHTSCDEDGFSGAQYIAFASEMAHGGRLIHRLTILIDAAKFIRLCRAENLCRVQNLVYLHRPCLPALRYTGVMEPFHPTAICG